MREKKIFEHAFKTQRTNFGSCHRTVETIMSPRILGREIGLPDTSIYLKEKML
jgi:hypothetical protein